MATKIEDIDINDVVQDTDAPGPPISVPDSGENSEGGKLKMIMQLLKKSLGVSDIAAMRLSLPASLLEPLPNLEYWCYLDRPDIFAAINDSADPFERMLAVLRFTFSKDLKVVHGKVCKPYNSVLGEHFRSHWDIYPPEYHADPTQPPIFKSQTNAPPSPPSPPTVSRISAPSVKSFKSFSSKKSVSSGDKSKMSPSTGSTSLDPHMSNLSLAENEVPRDETARVVFLTEQVSHHPPASTFYAACPSKHITLRGVDQLAARVSGTSLRIMPGTYNKGLFLGITGGPGKGEEYHITHPVASVNGILRGAFYATISESTVITCKSLVDGPALKAIIEYKEESWIGKAAYAVEGVIFDYDPKSTEHAEWTRVKHVPQANIIGVFDGAWRSKIRWKRTGSSGSSEYATLIDLSTLQVLPKSVRELHEQLPNESRKLWEDVTSRLLKKEYNDATKFKLSIEQKQRDLAAQRKREGKEFEPQYFEWNKENGYPKLLPAGLQAVKEMLADPGDASSLVP